VALHVATIAILVAFLASAVAGPHDATSRRRFDDVEHWRSVFDDPKRDAWQKPEALVRGLAIAPGMAVADVGAGTGYLSRHLSRAVGDAGTVLAVEVEPKLVAHLRTRAEQEKTANVVPVLGSTDDPRLPAKGVDLILILDTYHHIDDRLTYFRRIQRALRPGGRVAIVDWEKRDLPVGPEAEHKLAREHVVSEMEQAGWRLVEEPDVLPYQYVLVFRPLLES
jgi:ubiquinone/menaquinone biosynthesis C-methylase UbiE